MPLDIRATHLDVHAPGHSASGWLGEREVCHILHAGLPGSTWNLYAPGMSVSDGVLHRVWRLLPEARYDSYAEALEAAHRLWDTADATD